MNLLKRVLLMSFFFVSLNVSAYEEEDSKLESMRNSYIKKLEKNVDSNNYDHDSFEKLYGTFEDYKAFSTYMNRKELYHLIETRNEKMD